MRAVREIVMGWVMASFYDRFMRSAEEACLREWRAGLLAEAAGKVLEVGAGTGSTISLYGAGVKRLVLSEPDRHMRAVLEEKARARPELPLEISDATLEALPFPQGSFDCVVSMLVLCSVKRVPASLEQVRRVLKPGGRLLFLEHVAARDNPRRLKWQERVQPAWRWLSGNCHLARRTEQALVDAGFHIASIRRESIRKAMPLARPSIRGVALRQS